MKKSIAFLSILALGFSANAQDNKWWVQGGMNFASGSSEAGGVETNLTDLGFFPGVGYMLNENLAVGLQLNLLGSTMETVDGDETTTMKNNSFGATPFVRYYHWIGDNFGIYGQLDVAFNSGTQTAEVTPFPEFESKTSQFAVGIRPGVQYWFHEAWSVNANVGFLGFESSSVDGPADGDGDEVTTSGFGAEIDGTTVNFGLNFHF